MTSADQAASQGDRLIWILGGVVAAVGVVFYLFLNTGSSESATPELDTAAPNAASAPPEPAANPAQPQPQDFSVQLNRAQLAVDANMLTQPEGYSAWSIYSEILAADATNTEAATGLDLVAGRIVDEAFAELTAGRRDTAAELAERVLGAFPDHADAAEIAQRARRAIVADNAAQANAAPSLPEGPQPQRSADEAASTPEAPPPEPVNPIVEIYSSFTATLADGALRAPAEENAAAYLEAMRSEDAEHAMTLDAEQQLFDALFAQHADAADQQDYESALQWLATADALQLNTGQVNAARDDIFDTIAVQAATESIAATDLVVRNYVAPDYPPGAQRRGIEGWVDVSFVLSREGSPMSVEVTDSSSSIFRDSATRAVEQWEFAPHSVHDRVVEQHAHTRIRFLLED